MRNAFKYYKRFWYSPKNVSSKGRFTMFQPYVHPRAPCPTAQLNPPSAAKGAFQWKGDESTMSYPRSTSAFGWWVFRDNDTHGIGCCCSRMGFLGIITHKYKLFWGIQLSPEWKTLPGRLCSHIFGFYYPIKNMITGWNHWTIHQ